MSGTAGAWAPAVSFWSFAEFREGEASWLLVVRSLASPHPDGSWRERQSLGAALPTSAWRRIPLFGAPAVRRTRRFPSVARRPCSSPGCGDSPPRGEPCPSRCMNGGTCADPGTAPGARAPDADRCASKGSPRCVHGTRRSGGGVALGITGCTGREPSASFAGCERRRREMSSETSEQARHRCRRCRRAGAGSCALSRIRTYATAETRRPDIPSGQAAYTFADASDRRWRAVAHAFRDPRARRRAIEKRLVLRAFSQTMRTGCQRWAVHPRRHDGIRATAARMTARRAAKKKAPGVLTAEKTVIRFRPNRRCRRRE